MLVQIILKFSAAAGMTKLTKCLCFDLSDTLTCNVELLTNLFKCSCSSVIETESQSEYLLLTLCKCSEYFNELLLKECERCCVSRYRNVVVLDEIAKM